VGERQGFLSGSWENLGHHFEHPYREDKDELHDGDIAEELAENGYLDSTNSSEV